MPHAIQVDAFGGPEVLHWNEVAMPEPGDGEVRIRQTAVGLNYIDVYHRTGLYPNALPMVPGSEGAGVVDAVGPGVSDLKEGDRVAYAMLIGAYAQFRLAPADRLVRIPETVDDRTAAAVMLKGMTAWSLVERVFPVGPEHTILFHAAAGGVGLIACEWAASLGATVIGTVGSEAKRSLAGSHGCAHVINYREEDFVTRVGEITGGNGVDVVFDGVGKDVIPASLDCLKRFGMWVEFGQSSGLPEPFQPPLLAQKGSLYLCRPTLAHHAAERSALETAAARVFDQIAKGAIHIEIGQEFPLSDAAEAHRALESRKTVGATVLVP